MRRKSVTELQGSLDAELARVGAENVPLVITRRGKKPAVMISYETFLSLTHNASVDPSADVTSPDRPVE